MSMIEGFFRWFSSLVGDDDECHRVKVRKGGSLWQIAEELTGKGSRWKELADANPQRKFDENYTLQPGEELRVPKSWGEHEPE